MKFILRARCHTLPSPENRRRWYAEKAGKSGRCPKFPDKHGTLQHILNECFKNKDRIVMERHNMLVHEVETALLEFTECAKAMHSGKIYLDHD
jgi:hypothetical protein